MDNKKSCVEKLMEELNKRNLTDVVLAILYNIKDEKISMDPCTIQLTLYEFSENSIISELKESRFNISGIYPFSEKIYRVFYRLETAGLLPYSTNERIYFINFSNSRNRQKESYEKFNISEQEEIKTIATTLSERLKVDKYNKQIYKKFNN
ncbi:MAG: hypothetical protein PHS45_01530 [Bacilli bacterium]|nr:hypothetical protein [Bacilli bacterium]